jgi:hypothetical protein
MGTRSFLIKYSAGHIKKKTYTQEVSQLHLTKHYFFNLKDFKVAITGIYPHMWKLVTDPTGSTEHTLGTTA